MTDLSPYELRVLRQMVRGGDEDLICGAAMWAAYETLRARDLITTIVGPDGSTFWDTTKAGRALVRERDAELTETPNGHR